MSPWALEKAECTWHQLCTLAAKACHTILYLIQSEGTIPFKHLNYPRRQQETWRDFLQQTTSLKVGIWSINYHENLRSHKKTPKHQIRDLTNASDPNLSFHLLQLFWKKHFFTQHGYRLQCWNQMQSPRARGSSSACCRRVSHAWCSKPPITRKWLTPITVRPLPAPCRKQGRLSGKRTLSQPKPPTPPWAHSLLQGPPPDSAQSRICLFWCELGVVGNGTCWDVWHNP